MRLRELLGRFSTLARIARFFCRVTRAPPDERGGNRQTGPSATAPHLDSTGFRPLAWGRADGLGGPVQMNLSPAQIWALLGIGGAARVSGREQTANSSLY